MLNRGRGAIVNTVSLAAFNPTPGMYSPTKAFLFSLSEGLNSELKGKGIRVQAVCPGFTHTGFHDTSNALKKMMASILKGIWGTPDFVVKASLDGLGKGKEVVIPGLVNQSMMSFPRGIKGKVSAKKKPFTSGITRA